jgi:hypothetical protein
MYRCRDSSFGITTRLRAGRPRFASRQGLRIFLFTTASRPALGSTQLPIRWVPEVLSAGVKRPVREADHSSISSAEFKNAWSYTYTLQYISMVWCLVKHREIIISMMSVTFVHQFPFESLKSLHT